MEQEAFLLAIAQIAVTLAGFSGLVVAIRGDSPAEWHARDIWSLTWMFGTSFGALFLSLLPLVLASFHLRDDFIWISANSMSSWMSASELSTASNTSLSLPPSPAARTSRILPWTSA